MPPPMDRRNFLKHAGFLGAGLSAAMLEACGEGDGLRPASAGSTSPVPTAPTTPTTPTVTTLPAPEKSGIDHIVVVMMENRSFDHILGWVPGADGVQNRSFPDAKGVMRKSYKLSPDYQGCGLEDPPHGYDHGRTCFNGGAMDGFLKDSPDGDLFPIGVFGPDDVKFFAGCAKEWTIGDRYHSGMLASTQANRMYFHSGQSDRTNNGGTIPATSTLPTIWDAAKAAGISTGYYFNNLPYTAIWQDKYLDISHPYQTLAAVAAAGQLPNITYIDPFFYEDGFDHLCNDDHPFADVRNGQAFLNDIYNTLRTAPTWSKTLMVVVYDEWGGFADHVVPPFMPVSAAEAKIGNDGRLGFRVPLVMAGPRVKRGHVEKTLFEPNSLLKFMEWRWKLAPLGVRAAATNNLALALDFVNPPRAHTPVFEAPTNIGGPRICSLRSAPTMTASMAAHVDEVALLQQKAWSAGFVW